MDFAKLIHQFSILFGFFGINPFNPLTKNARKLKFYAEIYPVFLYLVLVTGLFFIAICDRYKAKPIDVSVGSLVEYTRIFIDFLMQLVFIGQALVYRERFKKQYRTCDFIQHYMKTRMRHDIDFKVFRRTLYLLILAVFVPHLAAYIFRRILMKKEKLGSIYINIFAIFNFLATLVLLHVIAHVELIKFHLAETGRWLRDQVSEYSTTSLCERQGVLRAQQLNGHNKILQIKFLHFKFWELITNFNRIFGWNLTAIILRNSIEIAYRGYWICMYSMMGNLYKNMSRK